jgi:hypothetical protein
MAAWQCCDVFQGDIDMRNFRNCLVTTITVALLPVSVSATPMAEEVAFCPMEALGDEAAVVFGAAFVETAGELSDAQYAPMANAIESCSKKHNWSDAQMGAVSTLSISALAAMTMQEKLTAQGISTATYDEMLTVETSASIQTIVDNPDTSPLLARLLEKFVANEGDKVTEKAAEDFGLYLAYAASGRSASNILRER